ncbi:MAG: hypothetical protein FWD37_05405, partial [Methanomassiliicoccaceae archaeon]|nr:hypothetical protein [Methanomassiliicoccaceae archaeon]
SFTSGTFTITKATLTVVAYDQTKIYGETDPELTFWFSGLVNGDDDSVFTGSLERTGDDDFGTYVVGVGDLSAGVNYLLSFTSGTFTITKATLTVVAYDQTKIYGETDPELTFWFSGLVNGDDDSVFMGSLERTGDEDAGTYTISIGNLSAGSNYEISFTPGIFTIIAVEEEEEESAVWLDMYVQLFLIWLILLLLIAVGYRIGRKEE